MVLRVGEPEDGTSVAYTPSSTQQLTHTTPRDSAAVGLLGNARNAKQAARRQTFIVWAQWLTVYTVVTAFFATVSSDPSLRISHGLLAYLLIIIGTSRETRRALSVVMVIISYLAVDWFFVPPRYALGRANDFDFYILAGFIVVAVIISQLVSNLKKTAELAMLRAQEIEQLGIQQLELEREAMRARESREAEAMKNALIASISHDLRSPITTVKMLSDPSYGIDPHMALARIGDEADRINRYLSTMRQFSDVGATGALLNVESHVVEDLIGTAIASYASVLRGREVRVKPAADEADILLVRCDFTLSLQVLGNLLQNAARHTPAPSPIDVWATGEGSQARIVVADRGPGVLPEEVELIFQARKRGTNVGLTGMAQDGQGMGLAIARTFARAQLGDVTYREREGGGAEFTFVLPRSLEF